MAKSKPGSAVFGAVILLVLVGSCVVLFRPVKQTPAEVAAASDVIILAVKPGHPMANGAGCRMKRVRAGRSAFG